MILWWWIVFLYFSLVDVNGANCNLGSPTSSSPCCNMGTLTDLSLAYDKYTTERDLECYPAQPGQISTCPICGELNSQNTANAKQNQDDLNKILVYFTQNNCFGGEAANNPGDTISSVPSVTSFAEQAYCIVKCDISILNVPQPVCTSPIAPYDLHSGPSDTTIIIICVSFFVFIVLLGLICCCRNRKMCCWKEKEPQWLYTALPAPPSQPATIISIQQPNPPLPPVFTPMVVPLLRM